ncbi:MAG: RES family NAD+ phosphorylase [Opitutaceae bacterium]|nr:RES family NAD+ phosphorylase [Opitutaceae bacterium]
MKSARLQPNPRFAEFQVIMAAHSEWLTPWSGTFFRFQTIDFPSAKDVLSGDGARVRGGRWNQPGLAAVYGSTTDTTALEECKANDRYYGVETKGPRLLVAIDAQLTGVIDLTAAGIRRSLGVTLKELAAEDWRKLMQAGRESSSQALGRAAAAVGASGLLIRSAAIARGVNVVVFPQAHRDDRIKVVEGEKLARLGVRLRA